MESSSSDEENNESRSPKDLKVRNEATHSFNGKKPENSDLCSEELLDKTLTEEKIGDTEVESKYEMVGNSSSGNLKFLSSEFFDQFVCQPSTSKDNPEIIKKVDLEKNIEVDVQQCSSGSSPEINKESDKATDNLSFGCKFRKNIENQETKSSDFKDAYKNAAGGNIPFPNFSNYVPLFNFNQPQKKTYHTSDEYFSDLRHWLQQAFFWQSVTAAFPYFLMCQQFGQTYNASSNQQLPPGFNFPSQFSFPFSQFQGVVQQTNLPSSSSVQSHQAPQRQQSTDGVECRIPSFWKRIAAEFIDFMILFFVKIAVTYVAIDFFHLVDLDQLDILHKDTKMAYKQFMQITQEIVVLELIHRLVVCAFETFWLRGGHNGQIGGATPGKSIMGLRVLHCESSIFIRESEGVVIVRPGTNLGLATAFFRSITKNFVLALLVPTSFAFIFFPHNRTGYDMICSTIVVEDPVIPNQVND